MIEKLKILIVEDQDEKYLDVTKKLKSRLKAFCIDNYEINRTANYTESIKYIDKQTPDIIILDLMIPVGITDGVLSAEASMNLLGYITSGGNRPFKIIALTAYEDFDLSKFKQLDSTLTVEHYSKDSIEWLNRLCDELKYLASAKAALMDYFSRSYNLDVLIIVARYENEFIPVFDAIDWVGTPRSDERISKRANRFGRIKIAKKKVLNAGLVCIQETGLSMSASLMAYLVSFYRPKFVLMLGMCCGLNDTRSPSKSVLGDIIIASETACWDEGKYSEELTSTDPFFVKSFTRVPDDKIRMHVRSLVETKKSEIKAELSIACRSFDLDKIAKECGEPINREPDVHVGLLLSGSSVVDSVRQVEIIRSRFRDAIGIEMEAHSIYCAVDATMGAKPTALVIKGVADHGQGKKNKAAQNWASAMSYYVARKILDTATNTNEQN